MGASPASLGIFVSRAQLRVLQVDPALFTPPYDAALTGGLEEADVRVHWVTRAARDGEQNELNSALQMPLYYRGRMAESVKQAGLFTKLRKATSHLAGSRRLLKAAKSAHPDLVHVQWAVVPLVDAWVIRELRRRVPCVLTVHDLKPFNGASTSRFQQVGFQNVLRAASALIVHTSTAREQLLALGYEPARVWTIPHGPLIFSERAVIGAAPELRDGRWRLVLFGKLQPYKGLDVLARALELLPERVRASLDVVVAGEPLMPLSILEPRLRAMGVDLRLGRLTEAAAHSLLLSADGFVFPYRDIEASGVFYLTGSYRRWTIASRLGAFRDHIHPGTNGDLFSPGDAQELANAMGASIGRRVKSSGSQDFESWTHIGQLTRQLYDHLIDLRART